MAKEISGTFIITVKQQGNAYTLEAHGPQGIRVEPQDLPPLTDWLDDEQQNTLEALADSEASPDEIQALGQTLYSALFVDPIAAAFQQAQYGLEEDAGLRLCLQIEAPELAALPWETMHDGQGWLATRSNMPLVRRLPQEAGDRAPEKLLVRGALRVLFACASPYGYYDRQAEKRVSLAKLRVEETANDIQTLLQQAIDRKQLKHNQIVFDVLPNATLHELQEALLNDYHILCFAAHGSPQGIYLDDGQGEEAQEGEGLKRLPGDADLVTAQTLDQALEGKPTRLVFLAACNTSAAPDESSALLEGFAQELEKRTNLAAIVAMQYPISDWQANDLTGRFFAGLAAFRPVGVALAEARKALIYQEQVGRDVFSPVMYLQAEDGALFGKARNWAKIALIAVLPFLVALAMVAGMLRLGQIEAEATAEAEATRAYIAEVTREAETTRAAVADATKAAESTRAHIAEVAKEAESTRVAEEQAQKEAKARAKRSVELAEQSQGVLEQWPQRSLLLAVEALHVTTERGERPLAIAERVLRDVLANTGGMGLNSVAVDVIPDNHWLITSIGGKVYLWDLTAKNPVATPRVFEGHEDIIRAADISPDNHWLVTASWDTTVRLWDLTADDSAANSFVLKGHKGTVESVNISPDSHWLVTVGFLDSTVRLWDLTTNNAAANSFVLEGHTSSVLSASISPDSHWLITVGDRADSTARLWDLTADDPAVNPKVLQGHDDAIIDVAISPDSHWLVTKASDNDTIIHLWDLTTDDPAAEPFVLEDYKGRVEHVNISPDSHWLVTVSSEDNLARLWDLTVDDPVANSFALKGHKDRVVHVNISPDSHWLVTVGGKADSTARLWDLTADDPTINPKVLQGHDDTIIDAAISPDSHWLVTRSGRLESTICIWDLATISNPIAAPISIVDSRGSYAWLVAFSSDSRWLVVSSGQTYLWDLAATGLALGPFILETPEGVDNMVIGTDNHWLVTIVGYPIGTVHFWNLAADDPSASSVILRGHEGGVDTVSASPDNHWLVTTGRRQNTEEQDIVRLWDLTAEDPSALSITPQSHKYSINAMIVSPDNHWLATADSQDNAVHLWDLTADDPTATFHVLQGHKGAVDAIDISADSRWLVTGSRDTTIRIWDLTAEDPSVDPIVLLGHRGPIDTVFISFNNHWLVTESQEGDGDGTVRLWDISVGHPSPPAYILQRHRQPVRVVAFSPDGHWLVTGNPEIGNPASATALLWDLTADDPATSSTSFPGDYNYGIAQAAISHDSSLLATADAFSNIHLWDLATDNPVTKPITLSVDFRAVYNRVTTLIFSPNDRWLVAGVEVTSKYLSPPPINTWLWDLTGVSNVIHPIILGGHRGGISAAAFSHDSRWLVTADSYGTAHLHDLTTEDSDFVPIVLTDDKGGGRALAISPDNHWLATSSDWPENTIYIWDITASNPAVSGAISSGDRIELVAFSSDNHWLVTGGGRTVRLWSLRLNDLVELACRTAGRNLSQEEWDRYFPDEDYRKTCENLSPGLGVTEEE